MLLPQSYYYISTQTLQRCPSLGITNSGRTWKKVGESDAGGVVWIVCAFKEGLLTVTHVFCFRLLFWTFILVPCQWERALSTFTSNYYFTVFLNSVFFLNLSLISICLPLLPPPFSQYWWVPLPLCCLFMPVLCSECLTIFVVSTYQPTNPTCHWNSSSLFKCLSCLCLLLRKC